ncbi:MAG: hypothetical protein IJZ55_03720 [Lachnospiraceae bacterium]|nr:hypothetical protein [Lachnospiraceae bacterium]
MGQCFFSGSNSGEGFHNYFDGVVPVWEKLCRYFMIKGGPGVGKSTLMKKVAERVEQNGETVERFYCSGDPDSLDAVRLVEKGIVFADATSPHAMDPKYPGAVEEIVNLGEQIDRNRIVRYRDRVEELTGKNKISYGRAYAFLKAAKALEEERRKEICSCLDMEKIRESAKKLFSEAEFAGENKCAERRLFLDAISCKGKMSFAAQTEDRNMVYRVTGPYKDMVTDCLVSAMYAEQKELFCSPLCPERVMHMRLPKEKLFLTSGEGTGGTAVYSEDFLRKKCHEAVNIYFAEAGRMEELAMSCLAECKKIHDELEEIYKECVDFSTINERTEQLLSLLERL